MFRIYVPGVGNIFTNAQDAQSAITAALRYLEQNNLSGQVNPADLDNLQAIAFNPASLPNGSLVINSNGENISTVPDDSPAPTPPANEQGGGENGISPTLPGDRGDEPAGTPPSNTPTGTPAENPTATATPSDVLTPEEVSREGAFRAFLTETGIDPNSVLGRTAANRQDQAFATLALSQLTNNLNNQYVDENGNPIGAGQQVNELTGGPQGFTDFLRGGGIQQSPGLALEALRTLAGANGATLAGSVGDLFAGAEPGTTAGNLVDQATLAALRTRLAPSVVNLLGGQLIQQAQSGFQDDLVGAIPTGDAPSYTQSLLRSIFGIG